MRREVFQTRGEFWVAAGLSVIAPGEADARRPGVMRPYLLRLLNPDSKFMTVADEVRAHAGRMVYIARSYRRAQNLLVFEDLHNPEHTWSLEGGLDDEEKLIGRRAYPDQPDENLTIDLYDAIIADDKSAAYRRISRQQARVSYQMAENTWWIALDETASATVFINNKRLIKGTPVPLMSDDVISFGPSLDRYYARLRVRITSKSS